MGANAAKCCSGNENTTTAHEQMEVSEKKADKIGEVSIPQPMPQQAPQLAPQQQQDTSSRLEPASPDPLPPPEPELAPVARPPVQAAAAPASAAANDNEFEITLDKTTGTKLGIDVDHQDGATLLIEGITGGLVEAWNNEAPAATKVQLGDRVVEVNGLRNDVLMLVDECKKNQVLQMKVKRCSSNSPP
mmetsp:Transcript_120125/g.339952  ORF Transcript_120125/g.339952 Transcript_120125/m.339952 type:complete len:189 (-) Transcript_120125:132-698(-)|eukprot:CAMPEP_0117517548 /NCGR_PEP_ID=MMETSP0784-20121206/31668_1 /TAXON_ID=39447 /ORGANISM="" /LENGTH=188 /DNA_ID=CAMNT_0005313431 /DNA_START=117 /DNA_END=683 /DNA_ORIENTATION=+